MQIPRVHIPEGRNPEERQPDETSVWLWPDLVSEENVRDEKCPWMDPYPADGRTVRPAVVIFPGGAYHGRAPHEGEPVARMFNTAGYHAFVVQYRLNPHRHPIPVSDAARAIRLIRQHAGDWRVDPQRVAVCGFSAGGHLAGSLACLHKEIADPDLPGVSCRPDAQILCYPVITVQPAGHRGSFNNLLGEEASNEQRALLSLETLVDKDTPPAFVWSTQEDKGVPCENALLYAAVLRRHAIACSLHVFPHGPHGIGLAPGIPHTSSWPDLACAWLKTVFNG